MSTFPEKELNGPYGEEIGAEEWLERPDHPLLNHLILEKLFVYVRLYDLMACRGVCKKWNVLTLPHMRSAYRVVIQGSRSIPAVEEETRSRQIDNFVELFRENRLGIPFSKFQLGPFCTTYGVGQEFLQLCGQTATELVLDDHEERDSEVHAFEDVSELLKSTPNLQVLGLPFKFVSRSRNVVKLFSNSIPQLSCLKKFTIRIYSDSLKEWENYCPTYIKELFTAAPNISEIEVLNYTEEQNESIGWNCWGSDDSDDWYTSLGCQEASNAINTALLNGIGELEKESKIQSLHLDSYTTTEHINQLHRLGEKENGLKLKSLAFSPDFSKRELDIHESDIQLVTLFQDTLQFLNLEGHVIRATTLTEFPIMSNLKSLNLSFLWNIDSVHMDLNKHFPVLNTLEVCFMGNSNIEKWYECLTYLEPCPTIKSLILRNNYMELEAFNDILRVFPNLKKLDLIIRENSSEILRGIWTEMTALESLSVHSHIHPRINLDSVFTGISADVLNGIMHPVINDLEKMRPPLRRVTISQLLEQHSLGPSIRSLTNLKRFNLNDDCYTATEILNEFGDAVLVHEDSEAYLSDLTGFFALHSMPHLRHLDIQYCGFTKTCCEILIADMGLDTWNFRKRNFGDVIIPSFVLKVD